MLQILKGGDAVDCLIACTAARLTKHLITGRSVIINNKKCIIALVLVLAIAIPIGLYVAGNLYYSAKRIYEQNWDIELPDKMKVKLDIKDGNSSHNDGVRYTVFEVKERSEFFDDFSSKNLLRLKSISKKPFQI